MSKNNQAAIIEKMSDKKQHFALRKYGLGVASFLVGLTLSGGYAVHAATNGGVQQRLLLS